MKKTSSAVLGLALVAFGAAPTLAETMRIFEGQPLCMDPDSLKVMVISAAAKLPRPNVACDFVKAGSTAQVVERYPMSPSGLRMIKVRVSAPGEPPVTGLTIQVEP
jgi:hypothetical protein